MSGINWVSLGSILELISRDSLQEIKAAFNTSGSVYKGDESSHKQVSSPTKNHTLPVDALQGVIRNIRDRMHFLIILHSSHNFIETKKLNINPVLGIDKDLLLEGSCFSLGILRNKMLILEERKSKLHGVGNDMILMRNNVSKSITRQWQIQEAICSLNKNVIISIQKNENIDELSSLFALLSDKIESSDFTRRMRMTETKRGINYLTETGSSYNYKRSKEISQMIRFMKVVIIASGINDKDIYPRLNACITNEHGIPFPCLYNLGSICLTPEIPFVKISQFGCDILFSLLLGYDMFKWTVFECSIFDKRSEVCRLFLQGIADRFLFTIQSENRKQFVNTIEYTHDKLDINSDVKLENGYSHGNSYYILKVIVDSLFRITSRMILRGYQMKAEEMGIHVDSFNSESEMIKIDHVKEVKEGVEKQESGTMSRYSTMSLICTLPVPAHKNKKVIVEFYLGTNMIIAEIDGKKTEASDFDTVINEARIIALLSTMNFIQFHLGGLGNILIHEKQEKRNTENSEEEIWRLELLGHTISLINERSTLSVHSSWNKCFKRFAAHSNFNSHFHFNDHYVIEPIHDLKRGDDQFHNPHSISGAESINQSIKEITTEILRNIRGIICSHCELLITYINNNNNKSDSQWKFLFLDIILDQIQKNESVPGSGVENLSSVIHTENSHSNKNKIKIKTLRFSVFFVHFECRRLIMRLDCKVGIDSYKSSRREYLTKYENRSDLLLNGEIVVHDAYFIMSPLTVDISLLKNADIELPENRGFPPPSSLCGHLSNDYCNYYMKNDAKIDLNFHYRYITETYSNFIGKCSSNNYNNKLSSLREFSNFMHIIDLGVVRFLLGIKRKEGIELIDTESNAENVCNIKNINIETIECNSMSVDRDIKLLDPQIIDSIGIYYHSLHLLLDSIFRVASYKDLILTKNGFAILFQFIITNEKYDSSILFLSSSKKFMSSSFCHVFSNGEVQLLFIMDTQHTTGTIDEKEENVLYILELLRPWITYRSNRFIRDASIRYSPELDISMIIEIDGNLESDSKTPFQLASVQMGSNENGNISALFLLYTTIEEFNRNFQEDINFIQKGIHYSK